jgi:hypothetical protein
VQRILQVQEKVPYQTSKSLVTKTPQQFEKTYKRKGVGLAQKMSETEEEKSTKRKKIEEQEEDEDQKSQNESEPLIKEPAMVIEVSSSTNHGSSESQGGKESIDTYQLNQVDHVHQFMATKKMGAKIKQNILPKIFDQGASQTRVLSIVDYEKGKLNIAVMESNDQKKVTNISIDLNAVHPVDKMDLHRHIGEMLNKDVMITSLGIKKIQTINEKIRNQLKQEKLSNKTKQMRVEELEQWVIDLGENPQDATSIQALMKIKDIKIHALKKKLNIPRIDHVQTDPKRSEGLSKALS